MCRALKDTVLNSVRLVKLGINLCCLHHTAESDHSRTIFRYLLDRGMVKKLSTRSRHLAITKFKFQVWELNRYGTGVLVNGPLLVVHARQLR